MKQDQLDMKTETSNLSKDMLKVLKSHKIELETIGTYSKVSNKRTVCNKRTGLQVFQKGISLQVFDKSVQGGFFQEYNKRTLYVY